MKMILTRLEMGKTLRNECFVAFLFKQEVRFYAKRGV
jgi:hypothetical protein